MKIPESAQGTGVSIKVGMMFRVAPEFGRTSKGMVNHTQEGSVVWVHPKGRFAVLEFEGVTGKPRECFFPELLTQPVTRKRPRKR